jgi:hypothetical protein
MKSEAAKLQFHFPLAQTDSSEAMLFAPLLLVPAGLCRTAIAFGSHPIGVFPEPLRYQKVSSGFQAVTKIVDARGGLFR